VIDRFIIAWNCRLFGAAYLQSQALKQGKISSDTQLKKETPLLPAENAANEQVFAASPETMQICSFAFIPRIFPSLKKLHPDPKNDSGTSRFSRATPLLPAAHGT
jgi:hypothetical protein